MAMHPGRDSPARRRQPPPNKSLPGLPDIKHFAVQEGSGSPEVSHAPLPRPSAPFAMLSASRSSSPQRSVSDLHTSHSNLSLRSYTSSCRTPVASSPASGPGRDWGRQQFHHPRSPSTPILSGWSTSPTLSLAIHRQTSTPVSGLSNRSISTTFPLEKSPQKLQRKQSSASMMYRSIGRGLGRVGSVMKRSNQQPSLASPSPTSPHYPHGGIGATPLSPSPGSGTSGHTTRTLAPAWTGRQAREGSSNGLQDVFEDTKEPLSSFGRSQQQEVDYPPGWLRMQPPAHDSADAGVSKPFNVQHDLHVTPDLQGMPPEWIATLRSQGLSEQDLLLITAAQQKQRAAPLVSLQTKMPTAPEPRYTSRLAAPAFSAIATSSKRHSAAPTSEMGALSRRSILAKLRSDSDSVASRSQRATLLSPSRGPHTLGGSSRDGSDAGSIVSSRTPSFIDGALEMASSRRLSDELRGFQDLEISTGEGWAASILAAWEDDTVVPPPRTTSLSHISQTLDSAPANRSSIIPSAKWRPPVGIPVMAITQSPAMSKAASIGVNSRVSTPVWEAESRNQGESEEDERPLRRRSKSLEIVLLRSTISSSPPSSPRLIAPDSGSGTSAVKLAPGVRNLRHSFDSFGVARSVDSSCSDTTKSSFERTPASSDVDPSTPPNSANMEGEARRDVKSANISQRLLLQPASPGGSPLPHRELSKDSIPQDSDDKHISVSTISSEYLHRFSVLPARIVPAPDLANTKDSDDSTGSSIPDSHNRSDHFSFPASATSGDYSTSPSSATHTHSEGSESDLPYLGTIGFGSSGIVSGPGGVSSAVSALGLCLNLDGTPPTPAGSIFERPDSYYRNTGASLSRMSSIASSTHSYALHEVTVQRAYTRVLRRVTESTETASAEAGDCKTSEGSRGGDSIGGAMGALEEAAWRVAVTERDECR